MTYAVTKRYGHNNGLSCCFRQWRANSHCRFIHGYALAFEFEFKAKDLDSRGWVIDFGSLKTLKNKLTYFFDHTTVVAADDPNLPFFEQMAQEKLAQVHILENGVGCEKFAELMFHHGAAIARDTTENAWLDRVTCQEHDGNSATVFVDAFRSYNNIKRNRMGA